MQDNVWHTVGNMAGGAINLVYNQMMVPIIALGDFICACYSVTMQQVDKTRYRRLERDYYEMCRVPWSKGRPIPAELPRIVNLRAFMLGSPYPVAVDALRKNTAANALPPLLANMEKMIMTPKWRNLNKQERIYRRMHDRIAFGPFKARFS